MRTRDFFSIFLIIFLLIGCSSAPQSKVEPKRNPIQEKKTQKRQMIAPVKAVPPDPASTALEEIRRQFKAEFAESVLRERGKEPALAVPAGKRKGFPKTLQAMYAFERQYGTRPRENAHLTVLKGMIQLETGQLRSASAMEPEMTKAAAILSNPSDLNRGGLLARNYKHLLTGWGEIYKYNENLKARDAGKVFPFPSTDFGRIEAAADQINENLRRHVKENHQAIRDFESDLGGLYVAAVAAAFYTLIQRNNDRVCVQNGSEECTAKKRENKEKAVFYRKGRDLIGLFLTESERNSAARVHLMKTSIPPWRMRYIDWYEWLSKRVNEASSRSPKKRIASR